MRAGYGGQASWEAIRAPGGSCRVLGLIGGDPSGRGIVPGVIVGEPRRQEAAESRASEEASRAGRIWQPGLMRRDQSTGR